MKSLKVTLARASSYFALFSALTLGAGATGSGTGCAAFAHELPRCTPQGVVYDISPDLCECGIRLSIEYRDFNVRTPAGPRTRTRNIYVLETGRNMPGLETRIESTTPSSRGIFSMQIHGEQIDLDNIDELSRRQRADIETYRDDFENYWSPSGFGTYALNLESRCGPADPDS